ncbi:hypothetical protein [Mangrovimonas aestuarii]|uniref:hypothetical protein n=1 Tax=Mangrovimonas aestuarii TaxID=3018443 RepID=UPI002378B9F8|nr:hypothetical protein [Mangrovimonas aestuarii]
MRILKVLLLCSILLSLSCSSDENNCCNDSNDPKLIVKFKFDPNQQRLDNLGQPAELPQGHAAQSPVFTKMSANYIELSPTAYVGLGDGEVIFNGLKTEEGGAMAIDFQNSQFAGNNEVFFEVPLNQVASGNYNWVRVSLAYQEGAIDVRANDMDLNGTLASFVGFNTYITSFDLNGNIIEVNDNKLQGYWAFETMGYTFEGQAPEGATTVPNPLFETSPIPQGSCVVTGQFENGFTITGSETEDVVVTLSFSVNNSFEWEEVNFDGKYEPSAGEQVVDMGVRGLIPVIGYQ